MILGTLLVLSILSLIGLWITGLIFNIKANIEERKMKRMIKELKNFEKTISKNY